MRRRAWLQVALLSLALLPALSVSAELKELKCELKEGDLKPDYSGPGSAHCEAGKEQACLDLVSRIDFRSGRLYSFKNETCKQVREAAERISTISGLDNLISARIQLLEGVFRRYEIFDTELSDTLAETRKNLEPLLKTPPPGNTENAGIRIERGQTQAEIKDPIKFARTEKFKPARTPTIIGDIQKRHFALKNGVNFMKDLLREQKEIKEAKLKLGQQIDEAIGARDRARTHPDTNGPGSSAGPGVVSGGGLNPTALMGLATAAAGLAGMINKQQADSDIPAATSPTPESLNPAAQEKPAVAVTKLDSGKSTTPPEVSTTSKAIDTVATVAAPSSPSGTADKDDSDISNSTPPPLTHSTPATNKAAGGGGGGDSSGNLPAGREPSGKGAEHKEEEEALQGLAGGGLGGGSGGGGSYTAPTDPAVAAAEDSMKDLLTEMKETADGGGDSEQPTDEIQAESGILAMDGEDLFPRVRAAHVRSLKQGKVLNGLGEKITEDSE